MKNRVFFLAMVVLSLWAGSVKAQFDKASHWTKDGYHYYQESEGNILLVDARNPSATQVAISKQMLTAKGGEVINIKGFDFTADEQKMLIYTNTKKVWRYETRGDYWVYNKADKTLKQIGAARPKSSLMFAKLSPDGLSAAYVSDHNIYVENLKSAQVKQLTSNGTAKLINGTFDWAYEEEFDCRDGFRWSPDGRSIAYWQIDASAIKNYMMLNTTDSVYPYAVPLEYPTAGQNPSTCRVGVVDISTARTTWIKVPGDTVQHYIPRMEWVPNSNQVILQQLNRAQNQSSIFVCDALTGDIRLIYKEDDDAWIDTRSSWNGGLQPGWDWLKDGKSFIWASEKDGWRHLYSIDMGGKETLLTRGDYDVITFNGLDEAEGYIYFTASPYNATQKYLFKVGVNGGMAARLTPANEPGTNGYELSTNGKIALHSFSNHYTKPLAEVVTLPEHKHLSGDAINIDTTHIPKGSVEFFKVKTADGIFMDGWVKKPRDFNPAKKYPVVFYVYAEPAGQTVTDTYGVEDNDEYLGNMADDGYVYISVDSRGTPAPKGREWRKSIYHKIGTLNIRDQAMATAEILKWPYIDAGRIAVWGWSGGGSTTLNLMFQYPEIYKTGIAIAAVANQLTYDDIYQERYMGVPVDERSKAYYVNGSPVTYAKNLKGNLLYIHGTADDNVHYQNAELLINELVKYNRQFQLMIYPNRTHSISEGQGTTDHLKTLYTQYLKTNCPPGGR